MYEKLVWERRAGSVLLAHTPHCRTHHNWKFGFLPLPGFKNASLKNDRRIGAPCACDQASDTSWLFELCSLSFVDLQNVGLMGEREGSVLLERATHRRTHHGYSNFALSLSLPNTLKASLKNESKIGAPCVRATNRATNSRTNNRCAILAFLPK